MNYHKFWHNHPAQHHLSGGLDIFDLILCNLRRILPIQCMRSNGKNPVFPLSLSQAQHSLILQSKLTGENLCAGNRQRFITRRINPQIILRIRLFFRWFQRILHRRRLQFHRLRLSGRIRHKPLQNLIRLPRGRNLHRRPRHRPLTAGLHQTDLQLSIFCHRYTHIPATVQSHG